MKLLFADELARYLSLSEDEIHRLARECKLPFAVSTGQPRRLFIAADELPMWRAAAADSDRGGVV